MTSVLRRVLTGLLMTCVVLEGCGDPAPEFAQATRPLQGNPRLAATLVKDLWAGAPGSNPTVLGEANGVVFFTPTAPTPGGLWRSDGTEAGTFPLKALTPAATDRWTPFRAASMNGTLYFAASDSANSGLWKSDGTEAGTMLVKAMAESGPFSFSRVNDTLFFILDKGSPKELWKTDGTTGGTVFITSVSSHASDSGNSLLTNENGTSYFAHKSRTTGNELWKSDGTPEGTVLVKDIRPGDVGSAPEHFTLVGDTLYFTADDGVSGREIWKSDGTEAGTVRVTDMIRGPGSASPRELTAVGDSLYFTADDAAHGRELWRLAIVDDTTPPVVTCPANVTAEATSAQGTTVSYPRPTASDDQTATPTLSAIPPSGSNFPLGTSQVNVNVFDEAGNHATCTFTVTVRDTTAPTVTCPGNVVTEATGAQGATVNYPPPVATDLITTAYFSVNHPSGSTFPLGATRVTVTARDQAKNSATCTFTVTVRDTTAPTLTCPGNVVAEATGAQGATVNYSPPTATDLVSSASLSVNHPSGSTFPLGTTPVTVTATDAANNTTTCAFTVTVQDTTAPTLSCPADVSVTNAPAEGQSVDFPSATALDSASTATVSYSHASGSLFAPGTTQVTVQATDAAGNSATCSFQVHVEAASPVIEPMPPPASGCAVGGGAPLGLGWLALLLLSRGVNRRFTINRR
ncbi:HYR domain-containing protein [Archangium minus]|uniref:HYR domain-containing protein n=1 Tax=Archangium minus TaxID=83450 RepID=A0ABY9WPV7_9BACT|nr:HYR domain-containing protein [Archangium minus]